MQAHDVPALFGENPALGGALQVAFLNQEGLVDFLQGVGFFADGDGHSAEADRAATIVFGHHAHDLFVHFIEAALVKSLCSVYHGRIAYPSDTKKVEKSNETRVSPSAAAGA